ncbi:hypothetical protein KA478_01350 [Patescibacteria group bacterium]|nr:hypothetical protein [Patescibacteria group bacterium]
MIHLPGTAVKCDTTLVEIFLSFQYLTIASASGCSDVDSKLHNIVSSDDSLNHVVVIIFVTSGFHAVIVHVLSKIIVSTLQSVSSGSPHFIKIHFSAHLPVHTINAVGVASHNAHGQAITITAEKYNKAISKLTPTRKYRIKNTTRAIPITNGTNIDEILSANHWIGAFDHCAS